MGARASMGVGEGRLASVGRSASASLWVKISMEIWLAFSLRRRLRAGSRRWN